MSEIKLTVEEAARIRELFGPCTSVFECTTPEELVASFDSHDHTSVKGFVETLYGVEEVVADRMNETAYQLEAGAGIGSHSKAVAENREFLAQLKARLVAAGLL